MYGNDITSFYGLICVPLSRGRVFLQKFAFRKLDLNTYRAKMKSYSTFGKPNIVKTVIIVDVINVMTPTSGDLLM